MEKISRNLIAPCGMNCGICKAYLRKNNPCYGCSAAEKNKPKTRVLCHIRNCKERRSKYCFNCAKYPCEKLSYLDKRYRTNYDMSEIENLEFIRDKGINNFIKRERKRWQSSKGIFCVHDKKYY